MKRFLVLLLCLSVLLLCACGQQAASGGSASSQPVSLSAAGASPEAAALSPAPESGWRDAYCRLLTSLKSESAPADPLYGYTLCDVDEDAVPELLVKFGTCEADYHGKLYAFAGAIQELADLSLWNTGVYYVPGKAGLLLNCGHMGYHRVDCLRLEAEGAVMECLLEEDLQDKSQAEYTPVEQLVPGALYLSFFPGETILPVELYEQIAACEEGGFRPAGPAQPPQGDGDFFPCLLREGGQVRAVAADAFMQSPGVVSLSRLGEPGLIYPYMRSEASLVRQETADLNGDGQEECLLYYRMANSSWDDFRVILSEQAGTVYAYLSFAPTETEVDSQGLLIHRDADCTFATRCFFRGDDCFFLTVPCPAS